MRSRLQLAGHVERMADDRLLKRAAELSRPQTINLYDGFVCHDTVVVVALTSD